MDKDQQKLLDLYAAGDIDAACALCDRLLAAFPPDAALFINAGKIYKDAGFYAKAEDCYRHALALPDTGKLALAAFNYAHLLLAQQRWRAGFTAYEARLNLPDAMPVPFGLPSFRADQPQGSHILLWSDQGLGDAIMFARFIPALKTRGYKISLLLQEPLVLLFRKFPDTNRVYGPLEIPENCDAALALGSLPFALAADPFWRAPYLQAVAEPPLPPTQKKYRVGLVWSGNKAHKNNANRSLPVKALAPLLAMPDIDYFSLQKETPQIPPGVRDLSPRLTDLAATAALIAQLDLVIAVDTSVAHLAGTLGKPVWVFLPRRDGDWRWGLSGDSSIWYPSMTLFRQHQAGDWSGPVVAAASRLEKHDF